MEPAPVVAERLGHGVDERRHVVTRHGLDLGHAGRIGGAARSPDRSHASAGTTPSCAQPSSAASSTSSQRASFASSDQTRAMAGRE